MPFVNGCQATQMIRSLEKKNALVISHTTDEYGRVPIFVVSATLREEQRESFADVGFDGWLLKPIDFKRLALILSCALNVDSRKKCLYEEGSFQQGGWFSERYIGI
jgi:CheY-like chemotaxis protein